jgi:L-seryl-tRNA(Ser) seleniumtransferase
VARNAFRDLPSVDRLLAAPQLRAAVAELGPGNVTQAARAELDEARAAIAAGEAAPQFETMAEGVAARAYAALRPSLRPVINATGVIIHTNLGRAPLSAEAIAAMDAVSRSYSNLEFDLGAGERGSRYAHVEALLCRLTGAEAAIAVNNNAAALLLVLSTLAQGKEVVISRGQLVEIGGGFRIPDVMRQSGVRLVEVGTTNRTYLADYENALSEDTAGLMRVHSSNFKVVGFTASADLTDLARLARERGLLLLDDLGSGCLLDTRTFGLAPEPTPQESLGEGVDLVMFSGDKLLGGPQAGLICGRADLIARLRRHPLARALRLDKATIAGLNATLLHYARAEAVARVPVWRMIGTPLAELDRRARRWSRAVGEGAVVVDARSMIGGGSLPEESLPTRALALSAPGAPLQVLAASLRAQDPPVVGRVEHERLLLDPRTVQPSEDTALVRAVKKALAEVAR